VRVQDLKEAERKREREREREEEERGGRERSQ